MAPPTQKLLLLYCCCVSFASLEAFRQGETSFRQHPSFLNLEKSLSDSSQREIRSADSPHLQIQWDRRSMILTTLTTGLAAILIPSTAQASGDTSFYDCLLDLPPKPPNSVRIYLCRHGQTENNRLHLVQGARLDPLMNDVGEQMGLRIGMALRALDDPPTIIVHSPLQRAKQTATLAASVMRKSTLLSLPFLGEIDFGPAVEGKAFSPDMLQTYVAWSVGLVDTKLPEGESARDVMQRGATALEELRNLGIKSGGSVVAVSHSMYLRMLLAVVMDVPLTQVPRTLVNGCINVLDVVDGSYETIGPNSMVVGGLLSQTPASFALRIPTTQVVRINEARHLEGLLSDT